VHVHAAFEDTLTPMQADVRPAGSDDLPAITALYLEVAHEVIPREPTFRREPDASSVERRYVTRIADRERAVLVAVVDHVVVGFVDALLTRHAANDGSYQVPGVAVYVEELIVTARHRRRGIAATLMHAVERWARDAGARMVTLDTHVTNDAARALYATMGYREIGVILAKAIGNG
jgi:GNAT superfamily N-acetyltransferase